jgi:UDP-GlcNAc:undecaprenyl-phosphate GlcNAc-1-phosphate transferase
MIFGLCFIGIFTLVVVMNAVLLIKLKGLGTSRYAQQVRWSSQAKPTIGGLSFMAGFLIAVGMAVFIEGHERLISVEYGLLFAGACAAFAMGLADDVMHTSPGSKFWVQLGCGLAVWFSNTGFSLGAHPAVEAALTILWVVALMNSVNMLDNMDGVSGGAALATLGGLAILGWPAIGGFISALMSAVLLGFLVHNRHPSKLFMGDAGSQLLGFLLAVLSLEVFGGFADESAWVYGALPLLFGTTLNDTALVTLNRLLNKRSPFQGGKDHSTHHLSYLGLRDGAIANVFTIWSMGNAGLVCFLLIHLKVVGVELALITLLVMIPIFVTFFLISRVTERSGRFTYHQHEPH